MKPKILVVDDEEVVLRSCARILGGERYELDSARDGAEALKMIEAGAYDVVVLDIMMPRVDGLEVLQQVKERRPELEIIMMTGLSEIRTAVRSMKLGALDYLPKPFEPDELLRVVERALERRRLREPGSLAQDAGARYRFENIIGSGAAMQGVYRLIAQCAPTHCNVLITGESGTGKEVIARAIHFNSRRSEQPFIAVDCNALSEHLLESELFGHVKGAFTGAIANKRGMFSVADHGTLFLDEIGNVSLPIQAKLLRVLQEREFRAVGGTAVQSTDVRLLTATNKDLKTMVAEGSFREDLYYRINVFPIHVPPLRERREDIPALAHHFLKRFAAELHKQVSGFSDGAMSLLLQHPWSGNVRELENAVHRAVILASDPVIRKAHLANLADPQARPDLEVPRTGDELKRLKKQAREKSVEDIEKNFVQETLRRNRWNVTRSAEETGMQRSNFQALMKKYNIRVRDGAPEGDEPDTA